MAMPQSKMLTNVDDSSKRTAQKVTHRIIEGGLFNRACRDYHDHGFSITWKPSQADGGEGGKDKSGKRIRYYCRTCEWRMWGTPADLPTTSCFGICTDSTDQSIAVRDQHRGISA
jgi:hypothetical protein